MTQRVVPTRACLEEGTETHELARPADGHHGAQTTGSAEQRDELPVAERSVGDLDVIVSARVPRTWNRMPY